MEELNKVQVAQVKDKLENLLKKIDEEGQKLGKDRTIQRIKEYRSAVQGFLNETVNKMYRLKEETSWSGGRHKLFAQVETVNSKLEELTRAVLEEQKDQIDILEKLGEIRGILVDIYS